MIRQSADVMRRTDTATRRSAVRSRSQQVFGSDV